ncbi:hypothetical protein ABIC28_002946 [Rhodococcus sp. PvR044]|nr:Protein of unknown function (DUF3054) [Rhodococcus sp. OK611]SNX93501.1 Protein of unknown function [Rhodococcus sp. OK270]
MPKVGGGETCITSTSQSEGTSRFGAWGSAAYPGSVNKRPPVLAVLAVDIVLVVVFCAIGRRSHDEANALAGLATTAWPFLGGLAAGWLANEALYRNKSFPASVVPAGVIIWLSTVVVGMILRVIGGQGTAFSFIIVATSVLAAFLLGWRAIYAAVRKRSAAA